MAEIYNTIWKALDKIENELMLSHLLENLRQKIVTMSDNVADLLGCFRLLQKEFLVDCLRRSDSGMESDNIRDPKNIKRDIREAFKGGDSVAANAFIFGTGISMNQPFNVPNWLTLLQRIHSNYFTERYGRCIVWKDVEETFGATDLYELAQYLESILSEDNVREYGEEFRTRTYNRLFSMVNRSLYEKSLNSSDLKNADLINSTIGYFAKLANDYNIQRILTYNYDDCFEGVYSTLYTNKITPIFVDEQLPYADEKEAKRIYHVHGLIPKYFDYNRDFTADNAYTKWLRSAEARHIVLTEDSYEEIAHSNYKWRNTVQADTLVRYNCFIFGFSASDRNFKRLTRLVDWHQNEINGPLISQPVKHYIFLTIDEYLKGIFHESLPRQRMSNTKRTEKFYSNLISLKNAKGDKYDTETLVAKFQFLYYTLRSKRKYLRRFHIYPIWTTVSDLRNRVESIIKYTDFNNN